MRLVKDGLRQTRRVLGGLALAGLAAAAPAAAETLAVGVQQVPPDEVYIARDWGQPYGLEVEATQFSSGGDMLKAFLAGRVMVANGGSGRLVTLAAQQPETFYIIGTQQSGGDRYSLVVRKDSEAGGIADLKGKKLGVVTGTGTYGTFLVYLQEQGLSEADFQIVNMKIDDLRAAVEQQLVDAAVMWEPFVAIAEEMGNVKRLVSMKGVNESPNFLLANRAFTDENPETIVKFLASSIDAADFIEADPAEAGQLAADQIAKGGVEVPAKALETAFTRISVKREVTDDMVAELVPVAEAMQAAGKIGEVPDFGSFVRRDLYEQALDLAGSTTN
ncbi:hypothetical protein D1122_02650 [Cereibacter sphaeroides]|uniref:ABC transporter substrate-binding protein n=1 Tax=Cereibacter sphaeroides TaxID=1063 RepID=UPI000E5A5D82|nr:NrtA/SsuA/CpmA family ABC transporter substrate-binding protein [Cereibacter sphaeroides]RIA00568.1 hypothetical protein D1122_02650 [Cereibacter sphaeroides]